MKFDMMFSILKQDPK